MEIFHKELEIFKCGDYRSDKIQSTQEHSG